MQITKCDRCGENTGKVYYEVQSEWVYMGDEKDIPKTPKEGAWELCTKCAKAFAKFMDSKDK